MKTAKKKNRPYEKRPDESKEKHRDRLNRTPSVRNIASLWKDIEIYKRLKISFTVVRYGTTCDITFDKAPPRKYIDTNNRIPGLHICKMVKDDLKKRIENGEYCPPVYPKGFHPNTVYFNHDNILKNLKKKVVAVDISGCYFDTALIVGIIGNRTYGLAHKEEKKWKKARNISIGSLGKKKLMEQYSKGALIESKAIIDPLYNARLHVLDHVDKIAKAVINECFSGWMMFLTDCFYVTEDTAEKLKDSLRTHFYNTTSKSVIFNDIKQIGTQSFNIYWTDTDKLNEIREENKLKKGTEGFIVIPESNASHSHSFSRARNELVF